MSRKSRAMKESNRKRPAPPATPDDVAKTPLAYQPPRITRIGNLREVLQGLTVGTTDRGGLTRS